MNDDTTKLKILVNVLIQQRNQLMDALAQATVDVQLLQAQLSNQESNSVAKES